MGCIAAMSGCGGGGNSSSAPTPTATPTPGLTVFGINALFSGATDPAVPANFITRQGQGRISIAEASGSFQGNFTLGGVNNRVVTLMVDSPLPLQVGQIFRVATATCRVIYSDAPNQRVFVAQSGSIRLDGMRTDSVTQVTTLNFSLSSLRMVPDTSLSYNSAVGSFIVNGTGVLSSSSDGA